MTDQVDECEEDDVQDDAREFLEAQAFVHPVYYPKDEATLAHVDGQLEALGMPSTEKHRSALSSVVVAGKAAAGKGSNLIVIPGDANYYIKSLCTRAEAVAVREALKACGKLTPVTKQRRGQAVVYELEHLDLTGRFQSCEPWSVRVREKKKRGQSRGREILHNECVRRFGGRYRDAEKRIERLNRTYAAHSLSSPSGVHWGGAYRVFNEGRLDKGGRLYGDWQQLSEKDRLKLTIDDEPVVEIDIAACFLFILSALDGRPITDRDPYRRIPWVSTEQDRKLAKRLIASTISMDGPLRRFPQGVRDKFSIPKAKSLAEYQDPILDTFPQLRKPAVTGMKAMFLESEAVLATIEELAKSGLVSYPVHDCLIIQEKHWESAARTLMSQMEKSFGARPWLTVSFRDGTIEHLDPAKRLIYDLKLI